MLNFESLGKTEDGKWAIKIFDEPFTGQVLVINSMDFSDETGEVGIDYACDYKDDRAVREWLEKFIIESLEVSLKLAEELGSDQDTQTNQTL